MRISVLTIFPEMFGDFLKEPVIRRAVDRGLCRIEIIDIRKFAGGSFRHIDDDTYGGGAGVVMRAQPVLDALRYAEGEMSSGPDTAASGGTEKVLSPSPDTAASGGLEAVPSSGPDTGRARSLVCVMTPAGQLYDQKTAHMLAGQDHLILICGHYEGIDERVMKHADLQLSIGDYVLTGGELPARVVMDSVIRLLGGVLRKESTEEESFEDGLLEYPQYTKPLIVEGEEIPSELKSGDHEKIRLWRLRMSLLRTLRRRPELLLKRGLTKEEREILLSEKLTEEERKFAGTLDRRPADPGR